MVNMILNPGQERVAQDAVNFFKYSSDQVFQMCGGPGTGKSLTMNEIKNRLIREKLINESEIVAMAYTGQAAIVMRNKGFPNARSIHSTLYTPTNIAQISRNGNILMNTKYNAPVMDIGFVPKPYLEGKKIMFIDEGRMVPLLMKRTIESYGIKIIVAGDPGQLGPIDDEPAYLVDGKIHYLTQIMRQAENSGIVYLANRALAGLPIQKGFYGNALVIDTNDITDEMIKYSDVIICGRNKTRDIYNEKVRRNILKINTDIPIYGERVICRQNNWNIEIGGISLANGLTGTCISMPNMSSFDGNMFTMDFLPDMLNEPFMNLVCDYRYYMAPSELKNEIKNDKYHNYGNKFDLAYALTTHLSQGAEYSCGMYIEEKLGDGRESRNLNNTGITRFRNAAIYVIPAKKYW